MMKWRPLFVSAAICMTSPTFAAPALKQRSSDGMDRWPSVICFSVSDADKFVRIFDQAPTPPSPSHIFPIIRFNSIRCTTVNFDLSFKAVVKTISLENHEYDIVNTVINNRSYYSFVIRQNQRS